MEPACQCEILGAALDPGGPDVITRLRPSRPAPAVTRFAAVILVDRRGWVLLQERDEHAPIDPDRWGLVGGHVEEGEDFEPAVHRELAEETGLTAAPDRLVLWREFTVHDERRHDGRLRRLERRHRRRHRAAARAARSCSSTPRWHPASTSPRAARIVVPAFLGPAEYGSLHP